MGLFSVLGSALAGAVGGKLVDKFFRSSDVADEKKRLDSLYPGTNAWERLGSSSSGVGGQMQTQKDVANLQANTTKRGQDIDAQTKKDVARINADATVNAANVSSQAPMMHAGLAQQNNPLKRQLMHAEHLERMHRSMGMQLDNVQKSAMSKLAHNMARARLTDVQARSLNTIAMNAARGDISQKELLSVVSMMQYGKLDVLKSLKGLAKGPAKKVISDVIKRIGSLIK